ncbi:hypothetical protein [Haliangium sp.]|uniref:hypothetical protein n=1 Tax=Haliangium sp. TaxID=2663208 RepID=UPI003D0CAD61
MRPTDLLLRFVDSTGSRREAAFYLELFRSAQPFALIAVSEPVLREASDAVIADLRFLARLGLTPALWLDGFEATPAGSEVLQEHRRRLIEQLRPEVSCAPLDVRGHADTTLAEAVTRAAQAGHVPILTQLAQAPEAPCGMAEMAALSAALNTRKLVFLGRRSGLEPEGAPIPSLVDLPREHAPLRARLGPEQAALLDGISALIDQVPHRLTVAVTSPFALLRELFTMRGAGTLIRRGARIDHRVGFGEVDIDAVRRLLESAFERPLAAEFFTRPVSALYVADDYRGLAVVKDTPHGPYLSKFAVERQAQGEGVGGDLWRALCAAHDTLLWRSRAENPVNAWYAQRCHGMIRVDPWQVFWRGLEVERVPAAVRFVLDQPADFPLLTAAAQ